MPMRVGKWFELTGTSETVTRLSTFVKFLGKFFESAGECFEKLWISSRIFKITVMIGSRLERFRRNNAVLWKTLERRWAAIIEAAIILLIALMPVLNSWEALLILTLFLYAIRFPARQRPDTGLLIFWISMALSALMAMGAPGLSRMLPVTVGLSLAGVAGRTFSAAFSRKLIRFMLMTGLLWMIIGFWQQWTGVPTPPGWLERGQAWTISVRSYSVFGNPNIYGLYLLSILSFAFDGISADNYFFRIMSGLVLILTVISLYFTYSRTAWLLGMAAAFYWFQKRIKSGKSLVYLGAGALLLSLLPGFRTRMAALASPLENTFRLRVRIWRNILRLITGSWLWGFGPGSFIEVYRHFPAGTGPVQHGHQLYLQLWLENGVLSLTAFGGVIVKSLAGFFGNRGSVKATALAILLFLTAAFSETWWVHPFCGGYFWLLIGLRYSLKTERKD
ncbi:MAG: hypothetical protein GX075_06125 [Firmicutes bacterium]|nr:hypothetical protein [Bacillota bacterium]